MLSNKIYTLLKVNECGSFVGAAEQLNLTQPAVSQHIKALEEELGVTIFDRGSGKVLVTKQGTEVIDCAKKLAGIYEQLKQDIRDGSTLKAHLTIGVTHTAESNPIAEALASYGAKNPNVNIKIITDNIRTSTVTNLNRFICICAFRNFLKHFRNKIKQRYYNSYSEICYPYPEIVYTKSFLSVSVFFVP